MPKCFNIFNKSARHCSGKSLRYLSEEIIVKVRKLFPEFVRNDNDKICSTCRADILFMKIPKEAIAESSSEPSAASSSDTSPARKRITLFSPTLDIVHQESLTDINNLLGQLGESPIKQNHLYSNACSYEKLSSIVSILSEKVFNIPPPKITSPYEIEETNAWLKNIKTAYHTASREKQIFILTTLPREYWPNSRIKLEFAAPRRLVNEAMHLLETRGPFSWPEKKPPREYSSEIISKVESFYRSDEVSRVMPGIKDKISVREGLERISKSKRLMLWGLQDAYELFRNENSEIEISFSKFASLRPKECILAGSAGTHNVCVCMIHENVRLMCKPISNILHLKDERELLKKVSCSKNSYNCALNKCTDCEDIATAYKENILNILDSAAVHNISYDQWLMQDRYGISTISESTDRYAEQIFNQTINKLKLHHFIAQNQSQFLKDKKSNLLPGEYIFIMDYSENYSMVNQNEIQAAHFDKIQATIHPIVAYFKDENGKLKNLSFVIISDHLTHNTAAVHMFQKKCIDFINHHTDIYPAISKIIYFTDGSAAQYKNKKNFMNLCYHIEDFGIPAEWHFFATSHGKGPSDGLGGTIKREARKASLRGTKITSAFELHHWAIKWSQKEGHVLKICFVNSTEILEHEQELLIRYANLRAVTGTQSYHCFLRDPVNKHNVHAKKYSFSVEYKSHSLK